MATDSMELDPTLWSSLADDLLEKIVARLPLKALVRSQILSKKWRFSFHSPLFQAEVSRLAYSRWPSYFPLTLTPSWVLKGLDPVCYTWEGLYKFPRTHLHPYVLRRDNCNVLGNLFAFCSRPHFDLPLKIVLTNPVSQPDITRTLPPLHFAGHGNPVSGFDKSRNKTLMPPFLAANIYNCPPSSIILLPDGYFSYKVLVLSRHSHQHPLHEHVEVPYLLIRVFHPNLNIWTECRNVPTLPQEGFALESSAHLERVCYLHFMKEETLGTMFSVQSLSSYLEDWMVLCAYGIDDDSLRKILLPYQRQHPEVYVGDCQMVVCGNELLFVFWLAPENLIEDPESEEPLSEMAYHPDYPLWRKIFMVSKLDLETLQFTPLARSPVELLKSFDSISTGVVFGDRGHVYFQMRTVLGSDSRPNPFPKAHRYGKPDPDLVLETVLILNPSEREEKQWTVSADRDHLWDEFHRKLNPIMLQPGLHPFIKV